MKTIRNHCLMLLHQPLYLLLCILLPLLALFAVFFGRTQDTNIQVGFLIENAEGSVSNADDSALMNRFRENLLQYPGDITFCEYTDPALLKQDCVTEKLECAYIVPADLPSALDQGHIRNQVKQYINRSTSTDQVVNQALYSCFFREYALRLLNDYLEDYAPKPLSGHTPENLDMLFHTYAGSDETFSFAYYNRSEATVLTSESLLLHAMIGILPLLGFLAALCTYFYYDKLRRAGAFSKMHYRKQLPHFVGYATLSGFPILLSLFISFCILQGFRLITAVKCLLLALILLLFQLFCYGIRATKKGLLSVTPLYLLSCIILSPMIFDLPANPVFQWISHLLLSNLFY